MRNQLPGPVHRGSRKRVERLRPFDELPRDVWVIIGIAATMLAITIVILVRAMVR